MLTTTTNDFEDTRQCDKVSVIKIDIDTLCLGGWKTPVDVTQLFMSCLRLQAERITSNCSCDNKIPMEYNASFFHFKFVINNNLMFVSCFSCL